MWQSGFGQVKDYFGVKVPDAPEQQVTRDYFENRVKKAHPEILLKVGHSEHRYTYQEQTPFLMLHPQSSFRVFWDIFSLTLLIWSLFSVPMKIAFDFDEANGCLGFTEQVFPLPDPPDECS